MSRHFFLTSTVVQPTVRWREAFPGGVAGSRDEIVAAAGPGDLVWVATADPRWDSAVAELSAILPGCPLVVLTMALDEAEGLRALERGARGYCHGLAVAGLLREVAQVVGLGGLWVGPQLLARVVAAASRKLPPAKDDRLSAALSVREAEVARLVAEGLSNKEVASRLGITERTVKAHLSAVFEKLGVRDRLQLVLLLAERMEVAR